jgi:hypothetical protein
VSIAVMNWVWLHSRTSGNERLVLLALADACSRDDGSGCWPSVPTIARKANISERSAWRVIARLEESGRLKVTRTGGGPARRTNAYTLVMHESAEPAPAGDDPCQNVTPDNLTGAVDNPGRPLTDRQGRGDTRVRPGVTRVSGDPPENQTPSGGHAKRAAPNSAKARTDRRQADHKPTAKALIAGYAAACPARPPAAVLGQLGKHAAAMLAEGISPDAITAALERFREQPMHPSVLPSLVNEQLNPARAASRPAPPAGVALAVPDADPDNPAAYIAAVRGNRYRPATRGGQAQDLTTQKYGPGSTDI